MESLAENCGYPLVSAVNLRYVCCKFGCHFELGFCLGYQMGFRIQEVTVGITAQISIKNNGLAITHSFYVDSTKKNCDHSQWLTKFCQDLITILELWPSIFSLMYWLCRNGTLRMQSTEQGGFTLYTVLNSNIRCLLS